MSSKNILILTAIRAETRAIGKALGGTSHRIHAVGIGAGGFRESDLDDFIDVFQVQLILMCGLGGGLDPALAVGDVILDDPNGVVSASQRYRRGSIYTAKQILAGPVQKAELFRKTGALAVDMEQAVVRELASRRRLPVVGIRAISDTADQILDPVVLKFVDKSGSPRLGQIAMNLLHRPTLIPYLRALNKNTNIALRELGTAVRSIVEQLAH